MSRRNHRVWNGGRGLMDFILYRQIKKFERERAAQAMALDRLAASGIMQTINFAETEVTLDIGGPPDNHDLH